MPLTQHTQAGLPPQKHMNPNILALDPTQSEGREDLPPVSGDRFLEPTALLSPPPIPVSRWLLPKSASSTWRRSTARRRPGPGPLRAWADRPRARAGPAASTFCS